MQIKLEIQIKFSRNVDKKKDYISVGGFEMIMNGHTVNFDFCTSYGNISRFNPDVCIFDLEEADYDSFPGFKAVSADDLKNISSITECFVYTGENGESDLEAVSIENMIFFITDEDEPAIDVSERVLKKYNQRIADERRLKNV